MTYELTCWFAKRVPSAIVLYDNVYCAVYTNICMHAWKMCKCAVNSEIDYAQCGVKWLQRGFISLAAFFSYISIVFLSRCRNHTLCVYALSISFYLAKSLCSPSIHMYMRTKGQTVQCREKEGKCIWMVIFNEHTNIVIGSIDI